MNQSLQDYNPPSFTVPTQRDYQSFVGAVIGYLQNQLAQYQIPYFKQLVNVVNTGTQGFGADLASTAILKVTNWAHRITGTSSIATVTPPNGFQSFIVLLSLDGFSFIAGGNISNPVAVAAGHPAQLFYDPVGLKWWVIAG